MSNLLDHYRNILAGYKTAVVDDVKQKLFGEKENVDYLDEFQKPNYARIAPTEEEKIAETIKVWEILKGKNIFDPISKFISVLTNAENISQISNSLKDSCLNLWNIATKNTKNNYNDSFLYWARLALRTILKESDNPILRDYSINVQGLLQPLEEWSRGLGSIQFEPNMKKILITGFDPFAYQSPNAATNPSGILSLYFHDRKFKNQNDIYAHIQTVIFPVRYEEFDNAMVEKLLTQIYPINQLDMIFTISQTYVPIICIDRLASNYRAGHSDNNNITALPDKIIYKGKNFYESTLPVEKIILDSEIANNSNLDAKTSSQIAYYEQYFKDDVGKTHSRLVTSNTTINYNKKTKLYSSNSITGNAVDGSGGDFLSNEIFYRVSHLRDMYNSNLSSGHIHVPKLSDMPITKQISKMTELFTRSFNVFDK